MNPDDRFTADELLILDVALNEFIWNLEDELDSWDRVNGEGFERGEDEWTIVFEMLTEAEELSDALQEILMDVEEDVYV